MQQNKKQSSTGKVGRGLSTIALGKYTADFFKTTEEIAYHCEVRDSVSNEESKAREQNIINKRVKHLEELEEKMNSEF